MLSKGGKIEYSCPYCGSTEITYDYIKEDSWAILKERPVYAHGYCDDCDNSFPWCSRTKTSLKYMEHGAKSV